MQDGTTDCINLWINLSFLLHKNFVGKTSPSLSKPAWHRCVIYFLKNFCTILFAILNTIAIKESKIN